MKDIYSKLISVVLTSTLTASWYFNLHSLQSFVIVIYWLLATLVLLAGLMVTHYINEFDENKTKKSEAINRFKSFGKRTLFDFAFSGFLSLFNVILLIIINSPITAALYLISALCSLKLSSSCGKRYIKAIDMD